MYAGSDDQSSWFDWGFRAYGLRCKIQGLRGFGSGEKGYVHFGLSLRCRLRFRLYRTSNVLAASSRVD